MPTPDFVALPKAVLHDHLDGGLRVETVLELAEENGYPALPSSEREELNDWFHQGDADHLIEYLEAFEHTVGVLQTPDALERAAYESAVDLAADGVVYAEVRFGPSLHLTKNMRREDALEAVVAGLARGAGETGIQAEVIATAMRQQPDSLDVARAAARFVGAGVVGFDLAGPEEGYPPTTTSRPVAWPGSRDWASRSTPASTAGPRASGEPSPAAGHSASATVRVSSRTALSTKARSSAWEGWRARYEICVLRSRSRLRQISIRRSPTRPRATRWARCNEPDFRSRSTRTTG